MHTPFKVFGPGPSAVRSVLVMRGECPGHRRQVRYVAPEAKAQSRALRPLGLLAEAPPPQGIVIVESEAERLALAGKPCPWNLAAG